MGARRRCHQGRWSDEGGRFIGYLCCVFERVVVLLVLSGWPPPFSARLITQPTSHVGLCSAW
jgi:hypothetical protein